MSLDVSALLSKFDRFNDRETPTARFLTNMPHIGPQKYLNILHKPASAQMRRDIAANMAIPRALAAFYECYNGLDLFADRFGPALSVYGCVDDDAPVVRLGGLETEKPYSFLEYNRRPYWPIGWKGEGVAVGSYSAEDGAIAYMDSDEAVHCCDNDNANLVLGTWPSLEDWLVHEIRRLSELFGPNGDFIGKDESETLPRTGVG